MAPVIIIFPTFSAFAMFKLIHSVVDDEEAILLVSNDTSPSLAHF